MRKLSIASLSSELEKDFDLFLNVESVDILTTFENYSLFLEIHSNK